MALGKIEKFGKLGIIESLDCYLEIVEILMLNEAKFSDIDLEEYDLPEGVKRSIENIFGKVLNKKHAKR